MNTYEVMKQAQEDLKYLNRLSYPEFKELLFSDSLEDYAEDKWRLFLDSKMEFIWSCSYDKLKLMADYIDNCN